MIQKPDLFQFTVLVLLFLLKSPQLMDLPLQRSWRGMWQAPAFPPCPVCGDHSAEKGSEFACFLVHAATEYTRGPAFTCSLRTDFSGIETRQQQPTKGRFLCSPPRSLACSCPFSKDVEVLCRALSVARPVRPAGSNSLVVIWCHSSAVRDTRKGKRELWAEWRDRQTLVG